MLAEILSGKFYADGPSERRQSAPQWTPAAFPKKVFSRIRMQDKCVGS